jgi:hypothetical protein
MSWNRLHKRILNSSVWYEDDQTRIVWITMLAMADKNGFVDTSLIGLAGAARVPKEKCAEAIRIFENPDPDSSSSEYDGRRVEKIDGGWVLLNFSKYKGSTSTERVRRHRERNNGSRCNVTKRYETGETLRNGRNTPEPDPDLEPDLTIEKEKTRREILNKHSYVKDKVEVEQDKIRQSTKTNDKTSKVQNDLQDLETVLLSLPMEKDRDLARSICKKWPDLLPTEAVSFVETTKTMMKQLKQDPVEWLNDISLVWPPEDPSHVQGRNRVHPWLVNCLRNALRDQGRKDKGGSSRRDSSGKCDPSEVGRRTSDLPLWDNNGNVIG